MLIRYIKSLFNRGNVRDDDRTYVENLIDRDGLKVKMKVKMKSKVKSNN